MSENYCCVTWKSLVKEFFDFKSSEIETLIKEKSLPSSLFATVDKVIHGMHLYCPVCGSGLTEETKDKIPPRKAITPVTPTPAPQAFVVCPQCQGRPGAVICMSCRGKGKIKMTKPINVDKLMDLEDLKQKNIVPATKELEEKQKKELEEDV